MDYIQTFSKIIFLITIQKMNRQIIGPKMPLPFLITGYWILHPNVLIPIQYFLACKTFIKRNISTIDIHI